jgi:Putative prokaryotic signal transducing protein
VRLTVVPDEGAAEALCGLLRSEGIDCFYRDTDVAAAGTFGGTTFGGWREILVAEDDLERARELLPDPTAVNAFFVAVYTMFTTTRSSRDRSASRE